MEWYRKYKRPLALITCILFVTGVILTLIGMNPAGTGTLGKIGGIIVFVSLVPIGAIWVLNSREKKEKETEEEEGE